MTRSSRRHIRSGGHPVSPCSRVLLALTLLCLMLSTPIVADDDDDSDDPLARAIAGLEWRGIGPAFMSGRIADVAIHPDDAGTWYVAVGSGGVWKTINAGTTWQSIFDGQSSYSIGCLTIDPHDPATVWVGTGENVGGRHVGYGDGVYRSRDGGRTWENLGLAESEHIGRILVHPDDPRTVYVAAQGPLWTAGGERGLYMTTDGGATWQKTLGGGEYTGVNDVVVQPGDPDVLLASTHQRFRDVAALINGGPESGIHKSTDGGRTWREIATGLPAEDMGKIGLAFSPQRSEVAYAAIELGDRTGGFWRSEDGGESWTKMSDTISRGTGPHYYQEIWPSPHAFDRVYFADVRMRVTEDGGRTFRIMPETDKHVDNHALAFVAHDPDYLLAGCDGGLYQSWDLGETWKHVANLPVTQFYKVALDDDEPFYHVMGGTQDNNTQYGPSRTDHRHGIVNADWRVVLGGDGHQPAIEPGDPDVLYGSSQQCNFYRIDRPTGESQPIRPMPGANEPEERWNWDGPILISAHDPARLYVASQRLWRSDDRGDSWTALSGDLTRSEDRLLRPMMGRVRSIDAPWDLLAMSMYGTITSIAESPLDEDLLYVGTDDGLVQVSEDGGATWREAGRLPGVGSHVYINDLKADRFDRDVVYAVADMHKFGDFAPYVFRSTDRGRSWQSIAGDLPARHVVWRLIQDHVEPRLLFVGTEFGVFASLDGGERWQALSGGAPTIPFRDLAIQTREDDLVGATFGRGFWVLDDYSPLRALSRDLVAEDAVLFTPREAFWYLPRMWVGGSEKGSMGTDWFTAPNPPFGAVFTCWLADSVMTRESRRQVRERALAAEGEDTPYPGWDALREEELEDPPAVVLTVRDTAGEVVRHVPAPTQAGLHRVAWDLRRPGLSAERDGVPDERSDGPLVAPGTYTVELVRRVDGRSEMLAGPESFAVVPLRERGLEGMTPAEYAAFGEEFFDLRRRVSGAGALIDETRVRLDAIRTAIVAADAADAALYEAAIGLEKQIEELHETLRGNRRRSRFNDTEPTSINRRLGRVRRALRGATYGPTVQDRKQLAIAKADFEALREQLDGIAGRELPALESRLEAAGVPWTPGRPVPQPR
ncbi:glycosyl hydrolase [bacterium]|nr:glycosyl hydrolase [bacterium]